MLRRSTVIGCVLALMATFLGHSAQAYVPAGPAEPVARVLLPAVANFSPPTAFGVQMYRPLNDSSQRASAASASGVSWVRWPISWSAIEPINTKPTYFSYAGVDASVHAAADLHLRLLATIDSNPKWAATYSSGPIDKAPLGEFEQFVHATAERYDGDGFQDAPGSPIVDIWEFYNEPDGGDIMGAEMGHPYWGDYGKEYASMLCAAYSAVKSANPAASVAIGGVAYDWFREDGGAFVRTFLNDVLANGGGSCMDFMNFHYYPSFEYRWRPYGHGLIGKASYLRSQLSNYGLGNIPILISEAGHHSNNYSYDPSTPQEQANYVVKLFTQALAARAKLMIWWTWMDLPNYWGANGLITAQGDQKPAYSAYAIAASKLAKAQFVREVPPAETGGAAAQVYQFATPGELYIAWVEGTQPVQIRLPGRVFAVVDPLGTILSYASDSADGVSDGLVLIAAGHEPIYLERVD